MSEQKHKIFTKINAKNPKIQTEAAGSFILGLLFRLETMADAQIANLQSKLAEHRSQLAQVEQLLLLKHDDEVLLKLKEDLVQVISLTEELTSTRIAKSKPAEPAADAQDDKFKVGERVSAKFTGLVVKWQLLLPLVPNIGCLQVANTRPLNFRRWQVVHGTRQCGERIHKIVSGYLLGLW